MQNRLDHISHQMGWVMTRTARSPIFSQSHDFSCFIADARGTLISQADGIPIHTGGGGFAVRAILRDFKDAHPTPEDVFLLNDPYTAGGNHLPDWVIARPVFVAGTLVAFACNRAHQADIGGGAAGTYNSAATEIFHEGIRLPVLKLIEGGKTRDDLWRLLLINTRLPEALDGDLRAMIGSTRIGAERLALLVEELGADRADDFFEGVLDHADRRFRTCIDRLAEGVWRAEESVDNDCFEPIDGRIAVTLTVKDRRLIVDFAGTSPQIRGFKNSSIANSTSAVFMALASFFEPDLPKNEGAFRSVEIRLPEGTLVNARAPAPMTMNTVFVAHEIVHAMWKALGQALPERASAGWSKAVHAVTAGLRADGGRYVMYQWAGAPAGGGVEGRDGFHLIGHLITLGGLTLPNLETYEQLYPGALPPPGDALRQRRPRPLPRRRRLRLRGRDLHAGRLRLPRRRRGRALELRRRRRPRRLGRRGRPHPGRRQAHPGAEIRRRAARARHLSRALARRRRLRRSQDARSGARAARRARRRGERAPAPNATTPWRSPPTAAAIDAARTAALRARVGLDYLCDRGRPGPPLRCRYDEHEPGLEARGPGEEHCALFAAGSSPGALTTGAGRWAPGVDDFCGSQAATSAAPALAPASRR